MIRGGAQQQREVKLEMGSPVASGSSSVLPSPLVVTPSSSGGRKVVVASAAGAVGTSSPAAFTIIKQEAALTPAGAGNR